MRAWCMLACMRACVRVCVNAFMHVCMFGYVCVRACMCVCVCSYMHECMCACLGIYICMLRQCSFANMCDLTVLTLMSKIMYFFSRYTNCGYFVANKHIVLQ